MGLGGQLVRLAIKMNFHSLLNYHATCTLMLPKSKLIYFTENRTSQVEKNTTKIVIYLMDTAIHVLNNRACSLNLIL